MKDRIKTENIDIVYCPTEQMLADFFTKPLQGSLFEKFRKVLMGHAHITTLSPLPLSSVEERVARMEKTRITKKDINGRNEQDATEENGRENQVNKVRGDVTTEPEWTVVGRTRTYKKGSRPTINDCERKRKDESKDHSFV